MAPTAISTAPTPSPHLQEVMPSNQQYSGMQSIYSNIPHQSTLGSLSLLPPISEKLLSDIKNQLYVDLNSLLPNALFDPAEGMYLQVHQAWFHCNSVFYIGLKHFYMSLIDCF